MKQAAQQQDQADAAGKAQKAANDGRYSAAGSCGESGTAIAVMFSEHCLYSRKLLYMQMSQIHSWDYVLLVSRSFVTRKNTRYRFTLDNERLPVLIG